LILLLISMLIVNFKFSAKRFSRSLTNNLKATRNCDFENFLETLKPLQLLWMVSKPVIFSQMRREVNTSPKGSVNMWRGRVYLKYVKFQFHICKRLFFFSVITKKLISLLKIVILETTSWNLHCVISKVKKKKMIVTKHSYSWVVPFCVIKNHLHH